MIYLDVEHNGVPRHMEQAEDAVERGFNNVYDHTMNLIEGYAPYTTGELVDSIYSEETDEGMDIWAGADHAEWLMKGSGIYGPHNHPIVPTDSYALKFAWDKMGGAMTVWRGDLGSIGQAEFFDWGREIGAIPFVVWPRGMEANDFHERAARHSEYEAEEEMESAFRRID